MPGKFGSDFSAQQPSDDDLVKYGARWIRDIKQRIKDTLGLLINLETGALNENVVASANLKTLTPDPSGTWNQVDVNEKGQVTGGEAVAMVASANLNRFTYLSLGGFNPTGESLTPTMTGDHNARSVAQYSFTVPDGVNRVLVRIQGAGGGATNGSGGGGGGYAESVVIVTPGDVWLVWVGQGGQGEGSGGSAVPGSQTQFGFDNAKFLRADGGDGRGAGSFYPAYSGLTGVLTWIGGTGSGGTTADGGAAGDGSPKGNFGWGGTVDSSLGQAGQNGYVIIEYWQ